MIPDKNIIKTKDIGRSGEKIAARFLISRGAKILEKNWRCGHLEIDLIVQDGPELVFVEVKTSLEGGFNPENYLKRQQILRIKKAALSYAGRRGFNFEFCRFDLVFVNINHFFASAKINYFKNIG